MVDLYQLVLVEPDSRKLGWGVVKFSGLLQVNVLLTSCSTLEKLTCCVSRVPCPLPCLVIAAEVQVFLQQ